VRRGGGGNREFLKCVSGGGRREGKRKRGGGTQNFGNKKIGAFLNIGFNWGRWMLGGRTSATEEQGKRQKEDGNLVGDTGDQKKTISISAVFDRGSHEGGAEKRIRRGALFGGGGLER